MFEINDIDNYKKYYGCLDFDEIDNCILTFQYINDHVTAELDKGCFYKEVAYKTRDFVKLGICYDEWPHDSWQPYIMTHSYDKESKETFKSKDIEKIISIFNESKTMIREKTK